MGYTQNLKTFFMVITMLILGGLSIFKVGTIDLHAILITSYIVVPAVIIMGILGEKIGLIIDNPKNRTDADYKIAVLNALKQMDKSISLQELNEKLSKQVTETDLPEEDESEIE